jgi:hypothetical protein
MMSGGSWDYIHFQVEEVAERLLIIEDQIRQDFGQHLKLVAKALRDIEWVDSGDSSRGDEIPAIEAVLSRQNHAKSSI